MTLCCSLTWFLGCGDLGDPAPGKGEISSDGDLWTLVSMREPYGHYPLFPDVDSIATGTLNGSHAHRPMVRVSTNGTAAAALSGGRLPAGGRFPEGSTIVKEIRQDGGTILIAVMHRRSDSPFAAGGWLWAEFQPEGSVQISMTDRGHGCVGCHQQELGTRNDLVRTFERQAP